MDFEYKEGRMEERKKGRNLVYLRYLMNQNNQKYYYSTLLNNNEINILIIDRLQIVHIYRDYLYFNPSIWIC